MGDSITAFAYDRRRRTGPASPPLVNTATAPAYMPGDDQRRHRRRELTSGLARLDEVLAINPDYRFFAITYGTNDCVGRQDRHGAFRANLQMMIDRIKAAGREPVLSHVPYSDDEPRHAGRVQHRDRRAHAAERAAVGPDSRRGSWAHRSADGQGPPDYDGQKAMNQLWADAMRRLYPLGRGQRYEHARRTRSPSAACAAGAGGVRAGSQLTKTR